jgi:hypothetical protein
MPTAGYLELNPWGQKEFSLPDPRQQLAYVWTGFNIINIKNFPVRIESILSKHHQVGL